ncbi:MAG TPA: AI-2E family transporter [Planctomycetota bacterium]|nr:AI-2E family transporter [Planctomycetota bacterium]
MDMSEPPGRESVGSVLRSRWVKFLAVAACVALLVSLIYQVRSTIAPFVLAVVAAYIVSPAVEFFHVKLRLPRAVVVAVLMLTLTVLLVGGITLGISYLVRTVERVVPRAERALCPEPEGKTFALRVRGAFETIPNEIRVQIEQTIQRLPVTIRENFREISVSVLQGFGAVFGVLLGIILTSFRFVLFFVVTAYLLVDLPNLGRRAEALLPERNKEGILRVLREIDRNVHAYYRGLLVVCLALCGIYSVGLLLCGVDFAILIGVAGGLADMVPYLGLVVGMLPALLFSLVPYVGLLKPLGVALVFAFGETFAGMVLIPKIIGPKVGVHPVAVLLAIMVFGHLMGFLGVVFAVPLAAVVKVLAGELLRHYKNAQPPAAPGEPQ